MSEEHFLPLNRAILWILLSTLFISGSAFMGWLYYLHVREVRLKDDQYRIVAIVQNTPQRDSLKTVYLAELLNLSFDQPKNLYQFNSVEGEKMLLKHPVIQQAAIKKILPGALYINYVMRTPIAFIGDILNTAVDEEGVLFPFHPFFTPKRLPILYLGLTLEELEWGKSLQSTHIGQIAFRLLHQFQCLIGGEFFLKQLDVANALADSYGQRQIVMILEKHDQNHDSEEDIYRVILRLSADHTEQNLVNFRTFYASMIEKEQRGEGEKRCPRKNLPMIMDFRIPHLAFIRSEK